MGRFPLVGREGECVGQSEGWNWQEAHTLPDSLSSSLVPKNIVPPPVFHLDSPLVGSQKRSQTQVCWEQWGGRGISDLGTNWYRHSRFSLLREFNFCENKVDAKYCLEFDNISLRNFWRYYFPLSLVLRVCLSRYLTNCSKSNIGALAWRRYQSLW